MKSIKKVLVKTCACALAGLMTLSSLPVLSAQAAASGTLSSDFDSLPLGQIAETGDLKLLSTGGSDKTQAVESEGILTMSSSTQGHVGFTLKNERFQQSELTMDFRFNDTNHMTHGYEGLYVSPYCVEYDKTFAAVVIQPHISAVYAQASSVNAGTVAFDFSSDTWYRLKVKTSGTKISYKIWNRNDPEPEEWTQEHSYSLSGDGGLAVYTYQNNAESAVSVSLDNIQLTKNEGETIFQEDFNASADGAAGFFDKVDLIQDGSGTDDKKAELQEENVVRLSSQAEGFSGIQYVNYNYQNNIAQLKIKFAEDFEAAELTDGVYVAPVGTGLDEYAAVGVSPANGGTLSVRIQKPGEAPQDTQGGAPVSILPGAWYHLKIMTLEGQDGGENRICAKIWNEQEKEPAEWSIDHSYSGTVSSGSFSVFSYHSGNQANSVLIGDISSNYYAGSARPSGNTKLSSISIGGTPLEGFDGDTLEYEYDVPQESINQVAPEVTAQAADSSAQVRVTQASSLPGTAEITVIAENGDTAVYCVNFHLEGCKIESIEEKAITVRKGTSLEESPHPQTVKVTMESGTEVDTPVLWNMDEYDPENPAEQTVTGVLVPEDQYGMEVAAGDIPTLKVAQREVQQELFVSPEGSDSNAGTIDSPFLTVARAQEEVRKYNQNMTGDILVYLREGTYEITEPMQFGVEDSGSNGYYVVYQNYQDELPVVSGGTVLDAEWEEDPERPGVYKTTLDRDSKLRSLYVNGEPAKITEYTVEGQGTVGTMTITGEESWAETSGTAWTGIKFKKSDVAVYANPEDVEITQSKVFNRNTVGIQNIYEDESGEYIIFEPQQPFGAIFSTMAWGCNLVGTGSITIRNTLENLKNPGEFYFDRGEKTLYYYPPKGADINEMEFVIPESEGFMRINGESTSERVENIEFSGIQFSYDHYSLEVIDDPENDMHAIGYGGVQSLGLYRKFADHGNWHHSWYNIVDTPYASVDVQNARGIVFEGNRFKNISSSCGVSYTNDVVDSTIQGNAFINVAGNATNIGHPQHVFIGEDAKSDNQRFPVGVEGVCKNDQVVHNLVRNVSSEFYQCDAIMAFFVENCDFSHNDVADVPYTTMCVGWGWWNFNGEAESEVPGNRTLTAKNNRIMFNKLGDSHTKLPGDGGTLYTLGYQPNSIIAYNYIYDGPRSIYLDEGTEGFMVHDNVIQDSWDVWLNIWMSNGKIRNNTIYNNYTTTGSVNNQWPQSNPITDTHVETLPWSDPAQNIIDQAGLTGSYAELYKLLEIDTSGLEQAVETAKSLSGSDYDRISWNELEQALYAAEAYLSGGSLSQGSVDMMSRRLNKAIEGLKDRQENLFPYDASNFSITEDNGSLVLAWEAPEQAVDHYVLLGLGDAVEISADCGRYVIEDPEPGKVYILTLCAVDAEGKCSEGVTGFYSTGDYSAVPEESLLWLSAGDQVTVDGQGRVSSWESLGDSGISAEQPEQEAQPVLVEDAYGGQPVIRFDGVDDTMSFDLDLDGKSAVTIIAVSAYQGTETGTGDQNCLVYFDEDGSWGKTFVSPLADAISWRYGSGQENNNNVYQRESGAGNEFSVTAVVKDSAEESLFVDGKKVMTQTGKNAVLANNVAEGRLCSYYFGYEDHFTQYDLAELMIFDRALSDEEIGNIQAYLNLKYETDLDKVAGGISLENPEYPDKGLKLPEMPRGIELAIESSDPEGVIGADGSITWPEQETKVNVVCRVTNTLTKESVLTDSFELTLTPVVKADLSAAIAAAEGKQEAGYTPETWEPFAEALEYAKAVLADKNAAQAQVDEAAAELTEKMEALKEKADTSGLSAAIAAAEGKQEADYTPETWEPFAEALEYAKAVLADKNAAQAQVDEAMKALTEKMAALAETAGTSSKPGDSSSKPDTSRPGDISNPDDSSSKGGTSQNGQNTPQTGDQFYPGVFIVLIGGCLLSSAAYVLIKQRGHNS